MATINHVQRWNIGIGNSAGAGGPYRGFWELSRAMKKSGWKYKASSNGTTKDATGNPALDQWLVATNATNVGASAASIAAPTRGRATVTGLTGIVAEDKGRFLLIANGATSANNNLHQIEEVLSATSVRIDARQFAVAVDANNGALTWSIKDPMQELFSAVTFSGAIAWWCAQGPSTLKIPITAASTGVFKRGENIVQASTGAEGELVSYTYYQNVGWLVVEPRLRGTGAGAHGWDTANLITGGTSGATVTQVGAAIDYVHEVVFIKPTATTTIQILHVQVDKAGESAQLFSVLAGSAGCTATVHPGGGGTGNAFPLLAWVSAGTGTTPGLGVGIAPPVGGASAFSAHVSCVDAIPEQGYSADGSYSIFCISPYTAGIAAQVGAPLFGLHRMNDVEDGELALHVAIAQVGSKTFAGGNRISSGTTFTAAPHIEQLTFYGQDTTNIANTYAGMLSGFRARGGTANEAFVEYTILAQKLSQTLAYPQLLLGASPAQTMQASVRPGVRLREKIWLTAQQTPRSFKGSFRWLYWVNGGQLGDVYEGDSGWVQLANPGANPGTVTTVSGSAMILGPHDGTPVSIQVVN